MPKSAASPLTVACIICGAKMELTTVEPKDHRTVCTYRCPSRHLQELVMASLDVGGSSRRAYPSLRWPWLGRAPR